MARLILLCLLAGCGKQPSEVLTSKGRPAPIECATTGRDQVTCVDGAGLIWTCGLKAVGDAECIQTGQRLPEVK